MKPKTAKTNRKPSPPDSPSRVSTLDGRHELPALAPYMDAGRILAILAAAESGSTRDLFALYRDIFLADAHLQTEFAKRLLAVLGDTLTVRPVDKTSKDDVATADAVQAAIFGCPGWRRACTHILGACLYPVSVTEKVFRPVPGGYELAGLVPVHYQLLDYTSGHLQLFGVDPATGNVLTTMTDPDPDRYLVHRGHLLSAPDNWGGPMRSILFWWLLSTMSREWWSRFLDRYGSPFLVGEFQDDESRTILERAFSLASRLGGLVVSEGTRVEIKQAAASDSGQAYETFLSVCQREKSKLILGQTLSSEAQPTGLGSGTAVLQEGVRQDIRKFDASSLTETLRDQLVIQYCRINSLPGNPPVLTWGADAGSDIRDMMGLLKSAYEAGLEPSDDAISVISERAGFAFQRRSAAPLVGASPFSALAPGPAGDPQDLRRSHAEAARIVRESRSRPEAVTRLTAAFPGLAPWRIRSLVADVIAQSGAAS